MLFRSKLTALVKANIQKMVIGKLHQPILTSCVTKGIFPSEKANIKAVKNMIQFNISKNMILTKYSETEYEQAVKELEEEEAE